MKCWYKGKKQASKEVRKSLEIKTWKIIYSIKGEEGKQMQEKNLK